MTSPGAICVFAKVPRPGRVKTRLARSVGDERAAALAAAFIEDVVASLAGLPAVVIAFDNEPPERWKSPPPLVWPQGSGSLDARLERVLARALTEHPWAIALGADSPGLPADRVRRAIDELQRGRATLGPCRDGGFYLLGLRSVSPGMLGGVRWSTPHALADTEDALARAGMSSARLEPWFDVDEESDLADLHALLTRGEIDAPATARVLGVAR